MEGKLLSFLLTAILAGLLGLSGILVIKFGMANVLPRHILILRDVLTGKLREKGPGLKFFPPGFFEVFQMIDCRQLVLDPPNLSVVSRDGQKVAVDYQIVLWVYGFYEKDEYEIQENSIDKKGTVLVKRAILKEGKPSRPYLGLVSK